MHHLSICKSQIRLHCNWPGYHICINFKESQMDCGAWIRLVQKLKKNIFIIKIPTFTFTLELGNFYVGSTETRHWADRSSCLEKIWKETLVEHFGSQLSGMRESKTQGRQTELNISFGCWKHSEHHIWKHAEHYIWQKGELRRGADRPSCPGMKRKRQGVATFTQDTEHYIWKKNIWFWNMWNTAFDNRFSIIFRNIFNIIFRISLHLETCCWILLKTTFGNLLSITFGKRSALCLGKG